MIHGDNKGLVIPPRVAACQVVVIPIPNAKMEESKRDELLDRAQAIFDDLEGAGIRAEKDFRINYTPGQLVVLKPLFCCFQKF